MSDFEELDPAIHDQLRNLPPASSSLRDAHIAAALGEMSPSARRAPGRLRILTGIAAAAVVALGGAAFMAQRDDVSRPALNGAVTTLPPKTGADCSEAFAGLWGEVGDSKSITHNNQRFAVMFRDSDFDVYYANPPCSLVGTMSYWDAMKKRDNETVVPDKTSVCSFATEPLARFTDSAWEDGYNLVLVQTETGLSVYFEDRCDTPIATLDLP